MVYKTNGLVLRTITSGCTHPLSEISRASSLTGKCSMLVLPFLKGHALIPKAKIQQSFESPKVSLEIGVDSGSSLE